MSTGKEEAFRAADHDAALYGTGLVMVVMEPDGPRYERLNPARVQLLPPPKSEETLAKEQAVLEQSIMDLHEIAMRYRT
jgi:hypothetical protein